MPGLDGAPDEVQDVRLVVKGQGTVAFTLAEQRPFSVRIGDATLWASRAFRWDVGYDAVALFAWEAGAWERVPLPADSLADPVGRDTTGLDPEPACRYWFSIDSHNRRLSYGTSEARMNTVLASHDLGEPPRHAPDPYQWLSSLSHVHVTPGLRRPADVWRDPVAVDPPMKVVPTASVTMADMAAGEVTVPENLTTACQMLDANVAGERFVLDTDDSGRVAGDPVRHGDLAPPALLSDPQPRRR